MKLNYKMIIFKDNEKSLLEVFLYLLEVFFYKLLVRNIQFYSSEWIRMEGSVQTAQILILS